MEIQAIEASTKKGGRSPRKEQFAKQVWDEYKLENDGKNPTVVILFKRVNRGLENIRLGLNERLAESTLGLSKQEKSFLRSLNSDYDKSSEGKFLYSTRAASAHHKKFLGS